jgi:chemotaxis protein histidine kinase CheA
MAEAKSKSKTITCTLCDKPITAGKPVIIDDDPYHSDCAKAMEQSSGATEETEEDEDTEAEEADEDEDGEDEGDEDEADEEEEEVPAPRTAKKVAAKAPVKPAAKRVVVEEDEDEDEDEGDDEEEEEEVVVKRPAAKKAAPAKAVKRPAPVEEDEDEDEDEADEDEDEEEEEVVVRPAAKKTTTKAAPAKTTKRAAADYEEEDEPEARPQKAKTAKASTNGTAKKKSTVDNSGWGNPSSEGSKRYFVYQALKEVSKDDLAVVDGPGKPENAIKRAKRLHRDWAKATKTTLSEKDQNYTSMNIGWIYNHADELGLVMRRNEEAGTYRIFKAKAPTADDD